MTIKELRCPECNRLLGKASGEGTIELHCRSKECKKNYTFVLIDPSNIKYAGLKTSNSIKIPSIK